MSPNYLGRVLSKITLLKTTKVRFFTRCTNFSGGCNFLKIENNLINSTSLESHGEWNIPMENILEKRRIKV